MNSVDLIVNFFKQGGPFLYPIAAVFAIGHAAGAKFAVQALDAGGLTTTFLYVYLLLCGVGLAVAWRRMPLAAWPVAPDATQVVVVFSPGVSAGQAFDALAALDARVMWVDGAGGTWAVRMDDPGRAWRLYGRGALLVSQGVVSLGCVSWTRA